MERIKAYYTLTKPGIIYGNTLTGIAGFFVASHGKVDPWLLLAFVLGLALVISSACVLNNIIDRGIDKKMKRTKLRALATGDISVQNAAFYSIVLGLLGFGMLFFFVNMFAMGLGAAAYVLYIAAYGVAKRKTVHGTFIGSIPGAIPPVAGYAAVASSIDATALLLFLILVLWQMPHFYAIALFRKKDYEAANIPVLPLVKGHRATKNQILFYIVLFIIAVQALPNMGIIYSMAMLLLGGLWLAKALHGFKTTDDEKWARGLFGFSLYVLLGFSMFAIVDAWLV